MKEAVMKSRSTEGAAVVPPLLLGLAVAGLGCASTKMTSAWVDSSARGAEFARVAIDPAARGARFTKVAVICLAKDQGLQHVAEDIVAANMTSVQAVPSHRILGDTDVRDREGVKYQLSLQGFQGVLVMRLASVGDRVFAVDGSRGTFDGYYDWAGNVVYDPGYLETETAVHVISNLYSVQSQKLIWSSVSQIFDRASARSSINDVSKAFAKALEKDRLII
jgi:hypothetical protein